jgi:hypothetical protein
VANNQITADMADLRSREREDHPDTSGLLTCNGEITAYHLCMCSSLLR